MADNSLEELAKSLVGTDAQKLALENNPYASIAGVLDQVTPLATRMYQQQPYAQRSPGELLGSALATGLLGGLAENKAQDYQGVLLDRYAQSIANQLGGGTGEVEGLPTSLFNRSKQLSGLFALQQKQAQQQREQALADKIFSKQLDTAAEYELQKALAGEKSGRDMDQEIMKAYLAGEASPEEGFKKFTQFKMGQGKGRARASEESPSLFASPLKDKESEGETATQPEAQGQELGKLKEFGFEPLSQKKARLLNEYSQVPGLKREERLKQVEAQVAPELEYEKDAGKILTETRNKSQERIDIANQIEQLLDNGLRTGGLDQYLGYVSGDQKRMQESLKTLGAKFLSINRAEGAGATDKLEGEKYLEAGASVEKQEDSNREIARRMKEIALRDQDYADFVGEVRQRGGTITQANDLWSKYARENPLYKEIGGKVVPYRERQGYQEFFGLSGGDAKATKSVSSIGDVESYITANKITDYGQLPVEYQNFLAKIKR